MVPTKAATDDDRHALPGVEAERRAERRDHQRGEDAGERPFERDRPLGAARHRAEGGDEVGAAAEELADLARRGVGGGGGEGAGEGEGEEHRVSGHRREEGAGGGHAGVGEGVAGAAPPLVLLGQLGGGLLAGSRAWCRRCR